MSVAPFTDAATQVEIAECRGQRQRAEVHPPREPAAESFEPDEDEEGEDTLAPPEEAAPAEEPAQPFDDLLRRLQVGRIERDDAIAMRREPSDDQLDVEVGTVSADIEVGDLTGELELQSVSGDIEVSAGDIERATFESVSGDLDFAGGLTAKARLHAEAHSGNTTLRLPADTSATWEVETFSGNVSNDFGPGPQKSSEHGPGKWLKFTTGSGDARITVESFSGNVRLEKR